MLLFAIFIGAGIACQSAVNAKLRSYVLSPFTASMISFFVGAVALTILTFTSGYLFWEEWGQLKGEPLWIFTGGFLGVISLTMNVILFTKIGGVQTAVLSIFGQIFMGTLLDQFGWLHSQVQPLTVLKVLGLVLVVIGVVLVTEVIVVKQNGQSSNIGWKVVGVFAGMAGAAQAPVNGRLGVVLESPLLASQISFYVGVLTLLLVVLVTKSPVKTIKFAVNSGVRNYWIFAGGLLGAIYVYGAATLAPIIGTGQLVVFALFGQLVGSVVIDRFGLFGAMNKDITRGKIMGLVSMFVGVIVINLV